MTDSVFLVQGMAAKADMVGIMLDTRPEDIVPGLVWDAEDKQDLSDLIRARFSSPDSSDWAEDDKSEQRCNDGINRSFLCINLPNLVPKSEDHVQVAENVSSIGPGNNEMRGLDNNITTGNDVRVLTNTDQQRVRKRKHANTPCLAQQINIHAGQDKNVACRSYDINSTITLSKDNAVNGDSAQSITTQTSEKLPSYSGGRKKVKIKLKLKFINKKKRDSDSAEQSEIKKTALGKPACNTILVDKGFNSVRKLYACSHCAETFYCLWSLGYHMWSHTTCPHCGKRFEKITLLQRHVRIHSVEKPVSCPVCFREYSREAYLKRHMKKKH